MCFICCNGLYSTAQYTVAIPAPSQIWVRCARPAPVSTLRHKFYFKFSDLKPVSFQPLIRHQQLQIGSGSELELGRYQIEFVQWPHVTFVTSPRDTRDTRDMSRWHESLTHLWHHDQLPPGPAAPQTRDGFVRDARSVRIPSSSSSIPSWLLLSRTFSWSRTNKQLQHSIRWVAAHK